MTFNSISPESTDAGKDAKNFDVMIENLESNSWCTTFSQTITSVTPGSFDTSTGCRLGGTFDGSLYEFPFDKPVITAPSCTDTGEIWMSYIDAPGTGGNDDYMAAKFQISVDMERSKIIIKTVNGKDHDDDTINFDL